MVYSLPAAFSCEGGRRALHVATNAVFESLLSLFRGCLARPYQSLPLFLLSSPSFFRSGVCCEAAFAASLRRVGPRDGIRMEHHHTHMHRHMHTATQAAKYKPPCFLLCLVFVLKERKEGSPSHTHRRHHHKQKGEPPEHNGGLSSTLHTDRSFREGGGWRSRVIHGGVAVRLPFPEVYGKQQLGLGMCTALPPLACFDQRCSVVFFSASSE